jgi:extracellular elastinolytic metalloproteinase
MRCRPLLVAVVLVVAAAVPPAAHGAAPLLVVDRDEQTRTPRLLMRLGGTLTGPRRGDPAEIAQRYVRTHLRDLGLTEGDIGSLGGLRRVDLPGGGQQLRWRQYHGGVPALDSELRVAVTAAGEVLSVTGAPRHDLEPALDRPRLTAHEALRAAGAAPAPSVAAGPSGPRRTTRFAGGDEASLVLFEGQLAWRVVFREDSQAVWDVVVDAGSGKPLRRVNRVQQIDVYERHPGQSFEPTEVNLQQQPGWLPANATTMAGSYAHAWADANGNDEAEPGEDVEPGDYGFPPRRFGFCTPFPCTWNSNDPGSWIHNRSQGTVQAFYYVNSFHDWLRDELGFKQGAFEGGDRVQVQTFDGAGLNPQRRNNANMFTPPDGRPPVMQMYLFDTRDVHGGDDAAIVYHEYTHGLTNRLVTDADGWGALTSAQSAAMGEGWSDFFAMDYLVESGYQPDAPGKDGQIDLDEYTGANGRYKTLDCSVAACGGFTYANFGKIAGGPEVHADGEIWGQTLWELRDRLGGFVTRRIVYGALLLAPPEPSFLDMRNAILLADQTLYGAAHHNTIWDVFTRRGMGWFASTNGGWDVRPAASTRARQGGVGALSGRVLDADSGRPIPGATVRVGGHEAFAATAGADGAFALGGLPVGVYEAVRAAAPDGHDPETLADVTVPGGREIRLRRNWAAARSGAGVAAVGGVSVLTRGCRPEQVIDQDPGTGFSVARDGSPPEMVFQLGQAVTVTGFAVDPGNTCGDAAGSTTTRFGIALSADGTTWHEATYRLAATAAHARTALAVGAGAERVRFVRLRLLETANPQAPFVDFSELSVYGNALPAASLAAPAMVQTGQEFTLDAGATQDADGAVLQYVWDFDGDGNVDRVTAGATTAVAYSATGSYRPTVTAVDERGGRGSAAATVAAKPGSGGDAGAPAIRIPRTGRRARVVVRVRCQAACTGTLRLTVNRRTARKLRLGRTRTIGTKRVRLTTAGERRVTIKLSRKATRGIRRARLRTLRASLSAAVVDVRGRSATARRTVSIRVSTRSRRT